MPDVKEHGFLFKAEMILAILDGRKSQTRRVVTQHNSLIDGTGEGIRDHWPHLDWSRAWVDPGPSPAGNPGPYWHVPCNRPGYCDEVVHRVYPRVQVGDNIYAKETWALGGKYANSKAADLPLMEKSPEFVRYRASQEKGLYTGPWRSPLHMPRWAARIVLPVTRVKAERVGDISEADARAEGISEVVFVPDDGFPPSLGYMVGRDDKKTLLDTSAVNSFRRLWNSINGQKPGRSFADSPPTWCYEWEPWVAA